jgi:hypothetical protein
MKPENIFTNASLQKIPLKAYQYPVQLPHLHSSSAVQAVNAPLFTTIFSAKNI